MTRNQSTNDTATTGSAQKVPEMVAPSTARAKVSMGQESEPDLADDLLDAGRRARLPSDCVDLAAILARVRLAIVDRLGVPVSLDVDDHDPLCPVVADGDKVTAALIELAVSARDAIPGGGMLCITAHNVDASPTGVPAAGVCVALSIRDVGSVKPRAAVMQTFFPAWSTER
jgi:hypothetical protein